MPDILFAEFQDENRPIRYPFSDEATLTSVGGLSFGADTFLDASLYPIGGRERLYLSKITATGREVTLTIADPKTTDLATASFDPLDVPDILEFADTYGRPAGVLIPNGSQLALFQTWPLQEHRFQPQATEFCASCVIPMPELGLRGFVTDDGTLFTGDVWFVGEDGIVLREDGAGTIRMDVVGDPLFRRRLCQPVQLFTTPRFLRTINGMKPDDLGDFKITVGSALAADTVLRLYADDKGGLTIETVGQTLQGVI